MFWNKIINNIRKFRGNILLVLFFLGAVVITAQDLSQLGQIDVNNLSDQQVNELWQQVQHSGYSIEQLEQMAKSQGMNPEDLGQLKQRFLQLNHGSASLPKNKEPKDSNKTGFDAPTFGLVNSTNTKAYKKNPLFGYDFFNNPNISFTPNINLATPDNYRLGPGDVIGIDLWGAAEGSYSEEISKEGNIQISGVGQINLNGLSFQAATSKINARLKKIYYGISAPEGSYNKVYTNIVLQNIRTVQVNIIGEVKVPGTYALNGLSTVLNGLYAAGGPTENGTFRKIKVVRNGQVLAYFDFYKYYINGSEEGNLTLQDQDIIIVTPFISHVTIKGQVKKSGKYELLSDETFSDLMLYTGGFKADAYKKNIIIERYTDTQKEIKEFDLNKQSRIGLKNGDIIQVDKVLDRYENRVLLEGAVYHPGNYEYYQGMKLGDLLSKAEGIKSDANLDKAIIKRKIDDIDKEIISFSVKDVINKTNDIVLQPEDEVYIYSKSQLREIGSITINGAVNNPQRIKYIEGISVEDFIAMAGGFREGADPDNIQISRRLDDENFSTIAESFVISVNPLLEDSINKVLIQPYDVITVRYKKGFVTQKSVSITGEVQFPGNYTIENQEETISDLIEKAGGFTPYAYVKGATLIRNKDNKVEMSQKEVAQLIIEKDSLFEDVEITQDSYKVGIDLTEIMEHKKTGIDLSLVEGDEIIVPKKTQTVEVQGMVYTPSLVQYIKGKNLKHYVNNSGGFLHNAKKSKVFVLYQNGEIKTTKNFLFFRSYPPIEPGATILIPEKPERKFKVSTQEVVGISTGLVTLALLVDKLIERN